MKHKKIVLVVFFLTLFVFQQVQAGGTVPPVKNISQMNVDPSNANALAGFYRVYMYGLIPDGADAGNILPSHQLCQWPTDMQAPGVYGCGNDPNFSNSADPNNPSNSYWIVPEDYYLKNVIALEMNIMGLPPTPAALMAQAVASRCCRGRRMAVSQFDAGSQISGDCHLWRRLERGAVSGAGEEIGAQTPDPQGEGGRVTGNR